MNRLRWMIVVLTGLAFFSCASLPNSSVAGATTTQTAPVVTEAKAQGNVPASNQPAGVLVFPADAKEFKIELESMKLTDMPVIEDAKASGGKAVRVEKDSSLATIQVQFPAGAYTALVNEKAPSSSQDAFYVFLDERPYRVYPSDPPIGDWELTKRVPITFTVSEPKTITITIQPHSPAKKGETGMALDYIVFMKE
ncbi:MAG TPA: hypothetical protein PLW34_04405 [Termitinemataceae bacterium]|nr:hypothetical protein [Termitinemataceae bacterium]HOM23083.1 hypothetical protein [Termitinemataceae bacterium]HPP99933.1 hypothetical protein [Termitinemataceae bacterium]